MSIKKLFDSTNKSRNYLSDTDEKAAFEDVESERNVRALKTKQDTFIPQIDYTEPANFARYGSAYLYYKGAIDRIVGYYPYDGSDAEINEFYNDLLGVEKYIFDNSYPRTNGYAHLSADGWGDLDGSLSAGYGLPDSLEHIDFFGGPNTSSYTNLASAFSNPQDSKFQHSNVYDTDIYATAGLPSDYASGSRESNLKSDFDNGVTIEFWLKKDAFTTAKTEKEVIFDMWNNEASGSAAYGRIRVELTGAATGSPFLLTVMSGTGGSAGIFQQSIGTDPTIASLTSFKHYAITVYNSGSYLVSKLYVTGALDDTNVRTGTINALNSKKMVGRIGALVTASAGVYGPSGSAGAGKLSASLDEFRFWKVKRDSNQIARYYNTQVRGGANSDISNATLGVYYKFNEGITTTASFDSRVLDYSGRISNGTWTGYSSDSRTTSSAIIEATAAAAEYKDPIIYPDHPDVYKLRRDLLSTGSFYDSNNNSAFVNLVPSWILEESENETSDLRLVSHVIAAYLDQLYLQISAIPSFKSTNYTSASATPVPFAQHLPQSLGLYTPELFIDSNVMERFTNRNQDTLFESDLTETKNLIYLNLYNNLAGIFKAKGTAKAVKNVFRCFNLDDRVIKLKTYSNKQIYTLQDNLELTLEKNTAVNFNHINNLTGVVYQRADSTNADSVNFISGTYGAGGPREDIYGFTAEANIIFPNFTDDNIKFNRNFITSSLFGMYMANTKSVTDPTFGGEDGLDNANFQVFAVRDAENSRNVHFLVTSSVTPYPFPVLTSSVYLNVYDDEQWNLSVRLKPTNYPLTTLVSGSDVGYSYTLEFKGINAVGNTVQNSFLVTASIAKETGANFLKSAKRMYAGARKTNFTGALLNKTDVLFNNLKYWTKYIEDSDLEQHLYDADNQGMSGSYRNVSALDTGLNRTDVTNRDSLALSWIFETLTGSDSSGDFYYVRDFSSGSSKTRAKYGWMGGISGREHTGYGYGFATSSTEVVDKERRNFLKFVDPESPVSSDMINILSDDDRLFSLIPESRPDFYHVVEKSMYNAISEEMLGFFAGVVDFNNIIGEPVNRYRGRYKSMEKLREIFFRRVTKVSNVEKFIDYYKWLDDAISAIVSQLIPASAKFVDDAYNVVESHVLERNKYKTRFPSQHYKGATEAPALGINELLYNWRLNHHPVNDAQNTNSPWWQNRANRSNTPVISSSNADVNAQREVLRVAANLVSNQTGSVRAVTTGKVIYQPPTFAIRKLTKPYKLEVSRKASPHSMTIKGGVNFQDNKNIDFTYNALRPHGPVNYKDGFIPLNVLLGFTRDIVGLKDTADVTDPNKKTKRYFKVHHGRDWDEGLGYSNVKSSLAFPFNIIKSSVSSGYHKEIHSTVSGNITITNLHNDVYGPDMEKPLQGPFTEYAVGGHQSRHVNLNTGSSLDDYESRPEAWKILLGTCDELASEAGSSGAIGMVGPDYPWPAVNEGDLPYPLTSALRAVYYRDHVAKRPVNIRNIHTRTGSTVLGNFRHRYEYVHSVGAYSNPRGFVDNPPTLPSQITETPSASQGRTILDIHRTDEGHVELIPTYSIGYLTGGVNKTIIRGKFSSPGGIETMGPGYGDIRSDEYSVYNSLNYRNLTVRRPNQNMQSGTVSAVTGTEFQGTTGIRVFDIHGKDFGLRTHLMRHTGRFGRDSTLVPTTGFEKDVSGSGASYEQSASFNKMHRNRKRRPKIASYVDILSDDMPNTSSINFPDTGTGNPKASFVMTGAADWTDARDLISAITSSGFTYSGWLWFGKDSAVRRFFQAGRYELDDVPILAITKIFSPSDGIQIALGTMDAENVTGSSVSTATATWYWANGDDWLQTWHHVVVTWPGGNSGSISSIAPKLYLNGTESTLTADIAGYDYYPDFPEPSFVYGNFTEGGIRTASVNFTGDNFIVFGGNHNRTYPFSGSMDEISLWKRPLTSLEIKNLYNDPLARHPPTGGHPGNVTASAAFLHNRASLFDWIRGGEFGGHIDSNNLGVMNANNIIKGFHYSASTAYMPIAQSGTALNMVFNGTDPAPLVGTSASILSHEAVYYSSFNYDNFFVQHQIPRADRQYAWVTASLDSKALIPTSDMRYFGYAPLNGPQAGYYSSSATGYTAYFDFVSASSVLGGVGTASIFQPALDLNMYVNDPVDDDAPVSGNVLGYNLTTSNDSYYNDTLINEAGGTEDPAIYGIKGDLNTTSDYFNLLMTKRKNTFGYRGAPLVGPVYPSILRKHYRDNTFTADVGAGSIQRYTLKPVTNRAKPMMMNLDINGDNTTIKSTYANEKIYFSDSFLDETFISSRASSKAFVFEQISTIVSENDNYKFNWVLYAETLFPSKKNEFTSGSTTRAGYDNLYWRDSQTERIALHDNKILTNSYGTRLTQSSWPLDAPSDFLTRTAPSTVTDSVTVSLKVSNSAGELQNEYLHALTGGHDITTRNAKISSVVAGALYARKHMLPGPHTVVSPSGVPVPETGAYHPATSDKFNNVISLFAGEALWEAAGQAGILKKDSTTRLTTFESHSTDPWFEDYDNYKEQLAQISRGYAVIPEFRISENIEDYLKYGINAANKFDTFEIVGTDKVSTQASFYKDYSNSDFMSEFLNIGEITSLDPAEIMLVCSASIRFNPYKGFYPAQRTVQLVEQFKNSFGESVIGERVGTTLQVPNPTDGMARPIAQSLFAPGLLYNTIKSGMAVNYPVVTDITKYRKEWFGGVIDSSASATTWMLSSRNTDVEPGSTEGYAGGQYWDFKMPFETLITPEKYLSNLRFYDVEPYPSASLQTTSSFVAVSSDPVYTKMASNFFGEIGNFFLKGAAYTRLESGVVTDDLMFSEGAIYGARLKMRRSMSGSRLYIFESSSAGNNAGYGKFGAKPLAGTAFLKGEFPLPQDPRQAPKNLFQEDFTMYSRPTAFGPPIAGRPTGSFAASSSVEITNPADSVAGFNWAYTPPYYNGEAWADFIFTPSASVAYDLEKILSEIETVYWRVDPGVSASAEVGTSVTGYTNTVLLPTFSGNIGSGSGLTDGDLIYDGKNVNANAMQLSASLNCFGVKRVTQKRSTPGQQTQQINTTVGKRWIIQTKMETPMMNFNNLGDHPITNAASHLSLPTYSSASVPRGMWHQFGIIEPNPNKGVFLEIGDIPPDWLKFHYEVIDNNSVYNKKNASTYGQKMYQKMNSLTDLVKFNTENASKRLGELSDGITLKEAIVAVPYQLNVSTNDSGSNNQALGSKVFFGIDREKVNACLEDAVGTTDGDSEEFAGKSIRKLVQKMQRYILPPQFDFLNNAAIDPMTMYIFEFEYKLDQDDLSYIWQNLAPRNYKRMTKTAKSIAHSLDYNELLSSEDLLNEKIRWMVFKVKQRGQSKYEDQIISQVGESTTTGEIADTTSENGYPIEFNWPYDYVSFVEFVKFEAEVLYKSEEES